MNHVLEIKNICKFFQLGKTKMFGEQILLKAVNDVSFKLYEGETSALLGKVVAESQHLADVLLIFIILLLGKYFIMSHKERLI